MREALAGSNLGLWTSQAEWGLGQWEINLEYQRALEMADRHILFKLALRDLAAADGMAVTFMPKPFGDTTGSSCHLHLSLVNASGTNVFHDPNGENGVSASLLQAVGGVLQRAPDLMLFYAPTVNSYRRTTSGEFSGNGLSWGWDSRMVSCRVLTESPESTRLEWRVPGADVNPYLAIAAVLASAGDGIWTDADPGEPLVGEDHERPVTAAAVDARAGGRALPRERVRDRGARQGRGVPLRRGRPLGVGAVPGAGCGHGVGAKTLLRGDLREGGSVSCVHQRDWSSYYSFPAAVTPMCRPGCSSRHGTPMEQHRPESLREPSLRRATVSSSTETEYERLSCGKKGWATRAGRSSMRAARPSHVWER